MVDKEGMRGLREEGSENQIKILRENNASTNTRSDTLVLYQTSSVVNY